MRWLRQTAMVGWLAGCVGASRAEVFTDLSVVNLAVAISGKHTLGSEGAKKALAFSMGESGGFATRFTEHVKFSAEPCSLLLLGTGVISVALVLLRDRFRIKPEALVETQGSSIALPEAVART